MSLVIFKRLEIVNFFIGTLSGLLCNNQISQLFLGLQPIPDTAEPLGTNLLGAVEGACLTVLWGPLPH